MLPLKDNAPTRSFPGVTVGLIAANFVGNEGILIRNFHARRFEGRNGKLPVPIILNVAGTNAVKHH